MLDSSFIGNVEFGVESSGSEESGVKSEESERFTVFVGTRLFACLIEYGEI